MQKYEYLIVGAPGPYKKKWVDYIGQEELNELGNEGWQLISVLRTGQRCGRIPAPALQVYLPTTQEGIISAYKS